MHNKLASMYRCLPDPRELPVALYRAQQVQAMDRIAIDTFGLSGELLMERAGAAAFAYLQALWPEARCIHVLVGTGNNGGDGFVVARLALRAGLEVKVWQLGERERLQGDALLNARRYAELQGDWQDFSSAREFEGADVIVDGLLGTGLERPVRGHWAHAIEAANAAPAPILALDVPSGLSADTGSVLGCAIHAQATITFIALKQGLFTAEGPEYCGQLRLATLEVPARVYASQILSSRRLDWKHQCQQLRPRVRHAHKGHFGHVLVMGGDRGYGGAARLAAEAALRVGAGLVSLLTRPEHVSAVLAARPEIMVRGITEPGEVQDSMARATVLVIGPGLGRADWGRQVYETLFAFSGPKVVDADALNWLARTPAKRDDWILTPHPGEAARLLGVSVAEVQRDRFSAATEIQRRYGGVVVLKGVGSIVCEGGQRPLGVCTEGNPGMATGGMGDVLSGVLGGLLAQQWDLSTAAELGVCLHGEAGDRAARAGERGLLALDLMPHLRRLSNPDHV